MNQAAQWLCGVHDFSVFGREQEGDPRSPIRNLSRLAVIREVDKTDPFGYGYVRIEAECDFFLWNMCRRLVGLLVNVGMGEVGVGELTSVLGTEFRRPPSQSRSKFVTTAPAKGLCLSKVWYLPTGVGLDPSSPAGPSISA
jgi:tRNA pseudouridine(38-40) synthase